MKQDNDGASGRADAGDTGHAAGGADWGDARTEAPFGAPSGAARDGATFAAFLERLIDPPSYVAQYADLRAAAAARPDFDPHHHFRTRGYAEGRAPSFLVQPAHAMRAHALRERRPVAAPDLLRALYEIPTARRVVPNAWFNASVVRGRYQGAYPQLAALSEYELFEFYLDHCAALALSPNGLFDEERYRARYPDVADAVRAGAFRSGFHHFILYGVAEERGNLPGFGRLGLDAQDEAALLLHGPASLAIDLWWYDEAFYLDTNPDVHQAVREGHFRCGLEHFMLAGCDEDRLAHPLLSVLPAWQASAADGRGAWERLATLDRACAALPRSALDLDEACALHARLVARGGDAEALTRAVWPHVAPPPVDAALDIPHYLALNADVAAAVAADGIDAAAHWRHDGLRERRIAPGTNIFARRQIGVRDFVNWRSGVNVFAPFRSATGLGEAARGMRAALDAAGIAQTGIDVSGLIRPDLPLDLAGPGTLPYSINLIMLNPEQVPAFVDRYGTAMFDRRATVGSWVWELSAPRTEWKGVLSGFDLLLTPSAFCTDAFASFTDRPVRTVPYVVDRARLRALAAEGVAGGAETGPLAAVAAARRAGRRVVLFIMDASSYTARKGVDAFVAIARRMEAAAPGRFVFCIKTHSADVSGFAGVAADAPVLLLDGLLGAAELAALKAMADLYVSPHRSEGFGFNIVESLLLGVPAACSPHGGPRTLLGDAYPWFLPGALAEIGRDMGPYRREAIWFEPDAEAAAAMLLRLLDADPAEVAAQTEAVAARLAAALSPAAVGARLREVLTAYCGLDAAPGQGMLRRFRHLAALPPDESFVLPADPADAAGTRALVGACLEPVFSVLTATAPATTASDLTRLHEDLRDQTVPSWEWCITHPTASGPVAEALRAMRRADARIKLRLGPDDAGDAGGGDCGGGDAGGGLDGAALLACGTWLVLCPPAASPAADFLAALAGCAQAAPAAVAIYCDEYDAATDGLRLKPDWSPELAWSMAYAGEVVALRKRHYLALAAQADEDGPGTLGATHDAASVHALLLRTDAAARGGAGRIGHVDRVVVRTRSGSAALGAGVGEAAGEAAGAALRAVLARHAARIGLAARVEPGLLPASCRVRPDPGDGLVDVVIPTAGTVDPRTGAPYAEALVRSILARRPAGRFRLRLVAGPAAAALAGRLAALDPCVTAEAQAAMPDGFNFAAVINAAVLEAEQGEGAADTVVLLNDDMLALDDAWLTALLEALALPGVGVAGGQLLYPGGAIQHCGLALGGAAAAVHLCHGAAADDPAHAPQTRLMRDRAAVTGAMMAFRRATFARVGGFDTGFPVDFNDVDFCLRVQRAGLRVVYTPHAVMQHDESASARRIAADRLDARRFAERWAAMVRRDPWHNAQEGT